MLTDAPAAPQPVSRRRRSRAATTLEIKQTARDLLVEGGDEGLTLRAIARRMGMTAPAIYRYFPSREDLLDHVAADLYGEVTDALAAARDACATDAVGDAVLAVSRTFRRWALDHPREFGLLFGSPVAGLPELEREPGPTHDASQRLGELFMDLVARLYQRRAFPIAPDADIPAELAGQLRAWCDGFDEPLPLGVLQVFLSCWIRLYGVVCLEVFGHLDFAMSDAEPMFEAELRAMAELLNI